MTHGACKMGIDYRYLFGPVPSRRFGRSLGIDLTPFKTCSLDCIFCQLGRTARLTTERAEWVDTRSVRREIDRWLASGGVADYVTLSGSGEPTLHSGFGHVEVIVVVDGGKGAGAHEDVLSLMHEGYAIGKVGGCFDLIDQPVVFSPVRR